MKGVFVEPALAQQLLDILFNLVRCGLRGEPLQHAAFLVHQEFGEIPFDALRAEYSRCLFGQILEQGMGIGAFDVDFLVHGEGYTVIDLAELGNILALTRLLSGELIAGEAPEPQNRGL